MEHGTGGDGTTQVLQAIAGLRQDVSQQVTELRQDVSQQVTELRQELADHVKRTDERFTEMQKNSDQRFAKLLEHAEQTSQQFVSLNEHVALTKHRLDVLHGYAEKTDKVIHELRQDLQNHIQRTDERLADVDQRH